MSRINQTPGHHENYRVHTCDIGIQHEHAGGILIVTTSDNSIVGHKPWKYQWHFHFKIPGITPGGYPIMKYMHATVIPIHTTM